MQRIQQELMWESLCSMYHAHRRESEGRTLNALELRLVDALLEDQDSNELTNSLNTLSEALQGAEVLLLWCDLEQSGTVIATTVAEELKLRWPLFGPFKRTLKGRPSVIFDAWMIPILKALPIVRSGHTRSMVTRAWSSREFTFVLVAVHHKIGHFSLTEQHILDRGARVLKTRGHDHLNLLIHDLQFDHNDTNVELIVDSTSVLLEVDDTYERLPETRILSQNKESHERLLDTQAGRQSITLTPFSHSGFQPNTASTSNTSQRSLLSSSRAENILPDILGNRYQVIELLGEGGFGSVYKGYDPLIKRPVALKVLKDTILLRSDSAKRIELFTREAAMAASIRHPHIVTIYDLGFHGPAQIPFIVMEFLDGFDLKAELSDSGPLELNRFIKFMIPTLDALGMAHRHGLIHRDLKPSNFFVVNTERGDQIRVVDFGIAVALSESKSKEEVIAGTTRYCAPEYLRDQEISPRLDVYQMGVVMLELLTGQPAFEDRGTATIFDIIDGNIRRHPDFDRHPLSSVINRAVALDPKERYANGAEMCQALTEVAQRIGLSHLLSPSL